MSFRTCFVTPCASFAFVYTRLAFFLRLKIHRIIIIIIIIISSSSSSSLHSYTHTTKSRDGGEHKNHPPPPPPPPAAETRGVDVLLRREKTQTQKGNDFQIIIIRRRLYRWGTPGRDPKETTGTPKSSSGRPERRRKGTTRFVAKTKNAVAEKERWQPSVSRVDFDDDFDGGHNCPTK